MKRLAAAVSVAALAIWRNAMKTPQSMREARPESAFLFNSPGEVSTFNTRPS
jgi:hypothetical protein